MLHWVTGWNPLPARPGQASEARSTLVIALPLLLPVLVSASASACSADALQRDRLPATATVDHSAPIGDVMGVHDPAIIREGDRFYLFSTGQQTQETGLLPWRTSPDLVRWTYGGTVFDRIPDWARKQVPGTKGLWAPDIAYANGEYRLYYSVSTFGKNRSAIGLATTPTLDPADERHRWTDQGLVISSDETDDHNAIDPNLFVDDDGSHWLSFGSFWSGIKLVAVEPATGKPRPGETTVHAIAQRPNPGAIEAPFLIKRGGFYYLFVSFDFCCRGNRSSYHTVVGRSPNLLGPYLDRDGRPMLEGGGSVVLHADRDRTGRWRGPGHVAILREPAQDYIVYHAYDTQNRGRSALRIQPLGWTSDSWPVAL